MALTPRSTLSKQYHQSDRLVNGYMDLFIKWLAPLLDLHGKSALAYSLGYLLNRIHFHLRPRTPSTSLQLWPLYKKLILKTASLVAHSTHHICCPPSIPSSSGHATISLSAQTSSHSPHCLDTLPLATLPSHWDIHSRFRHHTIHHLLAQCVPLSHRNAFTSCPTDGALDHKAHGLGTVLCVMGRVLATIA